MSKLTILFCVYISMYISPRPENGIELMYKLPKLITKQDLRRRRRRPTVTSAPMSLMMKKKWTGNRTDYLVWTDFGTMEFLTTKEARTARTKLIDLTLSVLAEKLITIKKTLIKKCRLISILLTQMPAR